MGIIYFFFLKNVVEQGYGAHLSFWMLSAMLGMSSELGFGPGPPATPGRVHQAMGESGLASSVFPLAIQAPYPRLKILAMAFFEKKLRLCESFNAIIVF